VKHTYVPCCQDDLAHFVGLSEKALDTPLKTPTLAAMTPYALAYGLVGINECLSATALNSIGGNLQQLCRQAANSVAAGRSRAVEQATLNQAEKSFKTRLLQLWQMGRKPMVTTATATATTPDRRNHNPSSNTRTHT
jgi:hypothetical protein